MNLAAATSHLQCEALESLARMTQANTKVSITLDHESILNHVVWIALQPARELERNPVLWSHLAITTRERSRKRERESESDH